MTAEEIIRIFPVWAERDESVAAVFLVGSHAGGRATPESDIDFVMLTSTPSQYLEDTSWVGDFGEPSSVTLEDWGRVRSVREFYRCGLEVEFGITTPDWASHPLPSGTREVLKNGMKLLFRRNVKTGNSLNGSLRDHSNE